MRAFGENNIIGKKRVFGESRQRIGFDKRDDEQQNNDETRDSQKIYVALFEQIFQQPRAPDADPGVEHSEKQRCAVKSETRNEKYRKQKRSDERADVIERQNA